MTDKQELLDLLSHIELFQDFSRKTKENDEILRKILEVVEQVSFMAGETIIQEGNEGKSLFILTEGSVRILRNTASGERFAVVNLNAEQNVFFGEIALLDQEKRSATVAALTDCKTLELTRDNYLKICEKDPLIGFRVTLKIARRLSATLRKANGDITTLYQALLEEIDN